MGSALSAVEFIRRGLYWHAACCAFVAVLLADAMTRTAYHHRIARRRLSAALERAARPHDTHQSAYAPCCAMWAASRTVHSGTCGIDTLMRNLNTVCCELWWTSVGTTHDPQCPTRTRKDRAA
jgi:hypothetical protein